MSSFSTGSVVRQYQYIPTQAVANAYTTPETEELEPASPQPTINPGDAPAALLAAASQEAQALRAAALAEAEQLRRDAHQQGYAEGYHAGLAGGQAQAEAKNAAAIARMHQLLDALITERGRLLSETESDLVGLALAISQKVIGDLARSCSGVILQLARRAVDLLGNPDDYELRVSPEDYDMLDSELAQSGVARTWTLVADEKVAPGGCVVKHGSAQVDARPQAQLALVHRAFDELADEMKANCACPPANLFAGADA